MATGLLVLGPGSRDPVASVLGRPSKDLRRDPPTRVETDTLDADGAVTRESTVAVTDDEVARAMAAKLGASSQRPPAFSAVKVGGRKLYDAARRGEKLERSRARSGWTGSTGREERRGRRLPGRRQRRARTSACSRPTSGPPWGAARISRVSEGPRSVRSPSGMPAHPTSLETPARRTGRRASSPSGARAGGGRVARHGSILGRPGSTGRTRLFDQDGSLLGIYQDDGPKARPEVVLARLG
jgi:hypothetical protein